MRMTLVKALMLSMSPAIGADGGVGFRVCEVIARSEMND
jgi:hypothetical protein